MHPSPQRQGFALVIALSLMAFVLLLLLSLTSLVQVEGRSAKISQATFAAQQNALLGLQEALGELQKNAGPDQRVTATGSLWNSHGKGAQHLMGVWSSADEDLDGLPDGTFQRWMLSQKNSSTAENIGLVQNDQPVGFIGNRYANTDVDYVLLVGSGSTIYNSGEPDALQGVVASQETGNRKLWVKPRGITHGGSEMRASKLP
jgi:Tfp pilus assembly protein PilX